MNTHELNTAMQWVRNYEGRQNGYSLAVAQYHLLAQDKKTKKEAQKTAQELTKTKNLNPDKRPKVIDFIKNLAEKLGHNF